MTLAANRRGLRSLPVWQPRVPFTQPAVRRAPSGVCLTACWPLCLAVCLALCLTACQDPPSRAQLNGQTMGTTWSVVYRAEHAERADALQQMLDRELLAINDALSTYIPDAEISRLNDRPGDVTTVVSDRFATVLDAALAVSELTRGAYDVTVGPLIELWGFGASAFTGDVPAMAEVNATREQVGWEKLDWQPDTRTLMRPDGMRVDLSSVAKGYAVDRLSALLLAEGLENTLVEIGGELRARGQRPEGGAWRLAVESPEPRLGRVIEAVSVSDASVATSGDYRNYFEIDGRRYSHLVDPRTGYPVDHQLVSVTVVATDCMQADALATALIVLGLEEAKALAEREGIAAYFVARGTQDLEVHYSAEFNAYRAINDA